MAPAEGVTLVNVFAIHGFVGFNDDPNVGSVLICCLSKEESFDDFFVPSSPVECNPGSFLFRIVRIIMPPLFGLELLWFIIVPKIMKHIV